MTAAVECGSAIDQAREKPIKRQNPGEPQRPREASGPFVQAENAKAMAISRRELACPRSPSLGMVLSAPSSARRAGAENVDGDAAGEVGHVELERIPDAAFGDGRAEDHGETGCHRGGPPVRARAAARGRGNASAGSDRPSGRWRARTARESAEANSSVVDGWLGVARGRLSFRGLARQ